MKDSNANTSFPFSFLLMLLLLIILMPPTNLGMGWNKDLAALAKTDLHQCQDPTF